MQAEGRTLKSSQAGAEIEVGLEPTRAEIESGWEPTRAEIEPGRG
jgi:hypothetical protein